MILRFETKYYTREGYLNYLKNQELFSMLFFYFNLGVFLSHLLFSPLNVVSNLTITYVLFMILFLVTASFEGHKHFMVKYFCVATIFERRVLRVRWRRRI